MKGKQMQLIMKQADVFLNGEADAWFSRNHNGHTQAEVSWSRQMLGEWIQGNCKDIKKILEIGAGSGYPLAYLAELNNSKGYGIEPSTKAVESWEKHKFMRTADVELIKGIASELPFNQSTFDMVGFGFCLYLIDRSDIYKTIREADRVLKVGGYMYIEDFDPISRYTNEYQHKKGINTYKDKYFRYISDTGYYTIINHASYGFKKNTFEINEDERVSMTLLYKEKENLGECPDLKAMINGMK